METKSRSFLLTFVVLGVLLRLGAIYISGPSNLRLGDASDYLSAATSLCSSGSYPDRSTMPFFRAPGLPFFIAAVTLCRPEAVWVVKTALAIVDSFSIVLLFLLAKEFFQDQLVGMIAAGIGAVYPFFIAQASDVQTESLFMFFFLASFLLILRAIRSPGLYNTALAGACASAAALVRPVALILLVFLPLTFTYFRGFRNHKKLLLAFALGVLVCLGPWVTRNAVRFHEVILVNDAGGYNFWRGTSPELEEIAGLNDRQGFTAASERFERVISPGIEQQIDRAAALPLDRSRKWYELAIASFHSSPLAFARRLARNGYVYWRPWLNPQTYSAIVVIGSGLFLMGLDVLALIGWNALRQHNVKLARWCIATTLLFWLVQIPFQVVARFRVPITDPFLLIFASASLSVIWVKAQPKSSSEKTAGII